MTYRVVLTADAEAEFERLPVTIQQRVGDVLVRLSAWPSVSGAKPMTGRLKGHFRVRTGDWRVLFQVKDDVIVVRIAHRSMVYDD